MKKTIIVSLLTLTVLVSFYCGAAVKDGITDANADDASVDAGTDAGSDATVCDCPEPPSTCSNCYQTEVIEFEIAADATALVPLPEFDDGVIIQGWEKVYSPGAESWQLSSGPGGCAPVVFTEPPIHAPNIPVPSVYYYAGLYRDCRLIITRNQPNQ